MKSLHRKPVDICAIRGHFWRGVGSTRDLKQVMQVCQRCLVSRTVETAIAYGPPKEEPCPQQAA
ncbi:MAG: hypothetical protein WAN65_19185 [Candidatus Sulfotelmatobacter sp.]